MMNARARMRAKERRKHTVPKRMTNDEARMTKGASKTPSLSPLRRSPGSRRSSRPVCLCGEKPFRSTSGFTLIEMLVVIAIIALVAAMTVPMMTPFTRTRKLEQAGDVVKNACILARSKAIQQRKKFCVTILQDERLVLLVDYDDLRTSTDHAPAKYVPADATSPYCPHYLANYNGNVAITSSTPQADINAAINLRATVLNERSRALGFVPRTIPEGCRFALGVTGAAWTYVFLPTGSAWTADPSAQNLFDAHWIKTTYLDATTAKPAGPLIYGPQDKDSTNIIVYAMTGQAMRPDRDINR